MKKTAAVVSLGLSGLIVLAWPLVAYRSIFMFDAPFSGPMDGALRTAFVLLVVTYPLTFVGALIWVILKWRKKTLRYAHALLALLPIAQLFCPPFVGSAVFHYLKHRKKEVANGVFIGLEGTGRKLFFEDDRELREVLGPSVIYYQTTADSTALLVKQAKWKALDDDLASIDFTKLQYFAVILATHELQGPFSQEEISARWGLDASSPLFHEISLP